LTSWLSDGESGDSSGFTESLEVSGIHDKSGDTDSLANQVGWKLNSNLELDEESGVISSSKILSDWDDKHVSSSGGGNSTLWSLVGKGSSRNLIRCISIINTPLGVSTSGNPGPVVIGDWVEFPKSSSRRLNSISGVVSFH